MAVLIGVLRNWDLAICCGGSVKYAIANLLHVIASMQYVFATWKAASCRAAVLIAQTNVCATSSIAKCPDQMPVNFLTPSQRQNYGQYAAGPSQEELERYFHLSESDRDLIGQKRPPSQSAGLCTPTDDGAVSWNISGKPDRCAAVGGQASLRAARHPGFRLRVGLSGSAAAFRPQGGDSESCRV